MNSNSRIKIGILPLLLIPLLTVACASRGDMAKQETQQAWDREHPAQVAEREYQVTKLFEYDGCTVYRFLDNYHYHYWVIRGDQLSTITTQEYRSGKATVYREENIATK